ncbi:DUF3566 domain-containing protein [Streptomyces stramineus]|uniref:DUF3566 domain-containing protein n=1 Tax=Streptomyces TaxID=1883 RepID=UPI0031E384CD
MTDTRDPKPYHPPQAYAPPAARTAPDSVSDSGSGSAEEAGSGAGAPGAEGGKSPKLTKAAGPGAAESTAPEAKGAKGAGGAKEAKGAKAAKGASRSGAKGAKGQAGPDPRLGLKTDAAPAPAAPQPGLPPAQRASEPQVPRQRPAASTAPRTRTARLRVAKADPWSVMKVSFLLSIALGVCTIVAAAVLWTVMDAMGVFSAVGGTVSDATGSSDGGGFDLESFLSLPNVLMFTSVIAVIDVVLATALATLGAFVYNLSAGFVGGVELTLAEDE